MEKIPVVAVMGPTASGKSKLAVMLAKAFDGEIISADSMQIYKEMNIGTAKPTVSEMEGVAHHLLDFLDPSETFSVAQYTEMAKICIEKISARGKLPIIAGGTGLYIRSLLENISFLNQKEDEELRRKLYQAAEQYGGEFLLEKLRKFDPKAASQLHKNDIKRIVRAIETYQTTGITITEQKQRSHAQESKWDALKIVLSFQCRESLYQRINMRVDQMMQEGLLEEARAFFSSHYGKTAVQAIGYKELNRFFTGEITLEQAIESIKMETRRYAKRQMTWLRREENTHVLEVDTFSSFEAVAKEAEILVRKWQEN